MSSDSAEVRALLAVMADKMQQSWESMNAQEIGNAVYGLQVCPKAVCVAWCVCWCCVVVIEGWCD